MTARLFSRNKTEASLFQGLVLVVLPAERGLVHGATLDNAEHGHALLIPAGGGCILLGHAGGCRGARRAGLDRCAGSDQHRAGAGTEFEVVAREFVERRLVLEEDDLAVRLAASLE